MVTYNSIKAHLALLGNILLDILTLSLQYATLLVVGLVILFLSMVILLLLN
jgi:hypothetical protein